VEVVRFARAHLLSGAFKGNSGGTALGGPTFGGLLEKQGPSLRSLYCCCGHSNLDKLVRSAHSPGLEGLFPNQPEHNRSSYGF
jgi:hypothetical protein